MQGLSINEIAMAFSATTPEWFGEAKPQTKTNMKPEFKEAYQRLFHKLVGNLPKYSDK